MPSITISSNEKVLLQDHSSTTTTCENEVKRGGKEERLTFRDIAEQIVAKERLKAWRKAKKNCTTTTTTEQHQQRGRGGGNRSKSVALVGAIMEYLARRRQRRNHQPLREDRDSITAAESTSLL